MTWQVGRAEADPNHFTGDGKMVGGLLTAVLACEDGVLDRFTEAAPLCVAQSLHPTRLSVHPRSYPLADLVATIVYVLA
jgi:hypothetical protein